MRAAGRLRTYLGTAPGVGKTYRMLADGRRRMDVGDRVVIGWMERHGRPRTAAGAEGFELVRTRRVVYRGHPFEELDVDAIAQSGAVLALVDELAHTHPDGRRRRWEDVAELLGAGVEVWTTTNVANIASLRDLVARLTGAGAVESVPDDLVRSGEVVLVDMPADALRRRIAAGLVYSCEQVGGALSEYFRVDNLEALSELARAWMSGEAEEVSQKLLVGRGTPEPQPRPLVVAGVTGERGAEQVIRTAAQLARERDGDLLVVSVDESDTWPRTSSAALSRRRNLSEELGGGFLERKGDSAAEVLAEAARERRASFVVVRGRHPRLGALAKRSLAARLRSRLPEVQVEEAIGSLDGGGRRAAPSPIG